MTYEQPYFLDVLKSFITPANATILVTLIAIALGFLALFLVHSLTIWLSTDPESAFHNARLVASGSSTIWNSFRSLANVLKKISLRWVPGWNTMAKHMIEPAVHIGIDIMSLVFAHKHFEGVLKDTTAPGGIPFRGHFCGTPAYNENGDYIGTSNLDPATSKFCTFDSTIWAKELGATPSSDGNNAITNDTLILSTAHARKLQALVDPGPGEGESMFPALPIGPLLAAVQEISGIIAMVQTTMYDIAMHVIYTVLSELASVLFNIAQIVIRAVASVVMSLVSSGALTSIIKSGIDFLIALVVHVALPLLFAGLDLVMCLVNMIQPDTWPEQLACGTPLHGIELITQHISIYDLIFDFFAHPTNFHFHVERNVSLPFDLCVSQLNARASRRMGILDQKSLQHFPASRLSPNRLVCPLRHLSTLQLDATMANRHKDPPTRRTLETMLTPLLQRQRVLHVSAAKCRK